MEEFGNLRNTLGYFCKNWSVRITIYKGGVCYLFYNKWESDLTIAVYYVHFGLLEIGMEIGLNIT